MPGSSVIGNLAILLSMDTSAFERSSTHAGRLMQRTQRQFQQMGQRMTRAGAALSVGITAPFAMLMRSAIPAAIESREALSQVEASLASMGPAAGRTAAQLQQAASALQDISLFDDDDILRKVTANLLTFGNISGEIFDRAQQSIIDMATRLRMDLQPATIMVARALNDPATGLTALGRVGAVSKEWVDANRDLIRSLVETGRRAEAQGMILEQLERQHRGAAAAARAARPDAQMQEDWRTFQETVGEIALNVLPKLTSLLERVLGWFNQLSPGMQTFAVGTAAAAAALGPLLFALGSVVGLVGKVLPWIVRLGGAVGGAGAAAGTAAGATAFGALLRVLGPIGFAAAAAIAIFKNWDEITGFITRATERVEELETGVGALERRMADAQIQANAFTSVEAFEAAFWNSLEAKVAEYAWSLGEVRAALRSVSEAAQRTETVFWRLARGTEAAFRDMAAKVIGLAARMVTGIHQWVVGRLNAVWDGVQQRIERVKGLFRDLYQAVVGGSYIPDMVDGIGHHMRRLQTEMVQPAQTAAERTAGHFERLALLLDRLFPQTARTLQYDRELAELEEDARAGRISLEALAETRRRLRDEFMDDLLPAEGPTLRGGMAPLVDPDQIRGITEELEQLNERALGGILESFGRMGEATRLLARDINDVIEQGLRGMMRGFVSLKDIALEVLFAIGDAIISNIMQSMSGADKTGGIGGAIAGAFSNLFGGARAMGGPVVPGRYYLVGERGPELASFGRAGQITPNHALGGGPREVTIRVEPSPYFDVRVDERAGVVIARAHPVMKADTIATLRDGDRRRP